LTYGEKGGTGDNERGKTYRERGGFRNEVGKGEKKGKKKGNAFPSSRKKKEGDGLFFLCSVGGARVSKRKGSSPFKKEGKGAHLFLVSRKERRKAFRRRGGGGEKGTVLLPLRKKEGDFLLRCGKKIAPEKVGREGGGGG